MKVEVKCSVSNCSFWGQGNNCEAPSIMVEVDRHSEYDSEMASELGIQTEHQDTAQVSAETCCRTFKPKK
ncbi:hypothetical protein BEP19_00215 [Ammoniphilus oxalaticus]|uniref:DUF1540 domain-containing protein n=1 Tax=Ammoniphilus oxalaticus TaxID=66863 RepID=A0A419SRB1_9BACL|nr:DUF1540 domain-containing protein [Ammoniphilus oxalaticus]RKD27035.1 hypothetical protein BEP19_00215 [Ammoniphilus oxalaticus]